MPVFELLMTNPIALPLVQLIVTLIFEIRNCESLALVSIKDKLIKFIHKLESILGTIENFGDHLWGIANRNNMWLYLSVYTGNELSPFASTNEGLEGRTLDYFALCCS